MIRPHLETIYSSAVKAKRVSQDLTEFRKVPLKFGIQVRYYEHDLALRDNRANSRQV